MITNKTNKHCEQPLAAQQRVYFKNCCWVITADSVRQIDYAASEYGIYSDDKRYRVRLTPPIMEVTKSADGGFEFTQLNKNCQFLQFLINTSNFTWRKEPQDVTQEELQENTDHLVAKLCAIGYLCLPFKDETACHAVVAMDGKRRNPLNTGMSGKSLVGEMLRYVNRTTWINGRSGDPDTNKFFFDALDEKVKIIVIDDIPAAFPVESLSTYIAGDFTINQKCGRRITIPFERAPKTYISTDKDLKRTSRDMDQYLWKIYFSDFYNSSHRPKDDFSRFFFDEWDQVQWNLFWNMVAECVRLYLKFGAVQPRTEPF